MFKLDYSDGKPIYEQIKDNLKQLIIDGVLKTDDRIPSVRELAVSMAINPNTIQKAYRDLEAEGYIYSVRAKGSFVAPQKEVVKKSDTDEVMAEFKALVSKMKFLGITYGDVRSAVDEEFTEGEDNK